MSAERLEAINAVKGAASALIRNGIASETAEIIKGLEAAAKLLEEDGKARSAGASQQRG